MVEEEKGAWNDGEKYSLQIVTSGITRRPIDDDGEKSRKKSSLTFQDKISNAKWNLRQVTSAVSSWRRKREEARRTTYSKTSLLFCVPRERELLARKRSLAITFFELIVRATVSNGVSLPLNVKVRSGLRIRVSIHCIM